MEVLVIGKKIEMSQVFEDTGKVVPVTLVKINEGTENLSFKEGAEVIITGFSKGRGYAGVVKRHHFRGGPATHGQSDRHRAPGSIGCRTTPGRVLKGKRMAGRFGNERVTVKGKGAKIVSFDKESNILKVSGPIPGARNGKVFLRFNEDES